MQNNKLNNVSRKGAKTPRNSLSTDFSDCTDLKKVSVLIVGGGPAGLAAAIQLKCIKPDAEVIVIEKAAAIGNHNLSGAVLEAEPLITLLEQAMPGWREDEQAKETLGTKIDKDEVLFLPNRKHAFNVGFAIKIAKALRLGPGQMSNSGDYSVSISGLTRLLGSIAAKVGVEVLCGFAAEDIIWDESREKAAGIKLVDQGLGKEGQRQPNFVKGETISADYIILAEGCDGLLTEKFVQKAGLTRRSTQLYSVGVKELIKVSSAQYEAFTMGRVVHAMGWPIWRPLVGPAMFGGGTVFAGTKDHISVGMIVGMDWKEFDFNPQDALALFKEHSYVKKFIEGGTVVEAGARMIPEGGYHAIPRDPQTGSIGKSNVIIVGDSASFVNMFKIKGLHNSIDSGMIAAKAIAMSMDKGGNAANLYTQSIKASNVEKEMLSARNYRQTIVKFGPLIGLPLSALGGLLPHFKVKSDYKHTRQVRYKLHPFAKGAKGCHPDSSSLGSKPVRSFDKDTFTAMACTCHREDQPSHLSILDKTVCRDKCVGTFKSPCITFCPAGVYESVHDEVKPANPSNCLHCKTCQRKCPFDNIRWTVPEGNGGPRYMRM